MEEIKRGHYKLTESILECWRNQGYKYIKGKLSELFNEDNKGKYVNIKPYWQKPHHDDFNLFVIKIDSTELLPLLNNEKQINYIVSYGQL